MQPLIKYTPNYLVVIMSFAEVNAPDAFWIHDIRSEKFRVLLAETPFND